MNGDKWIHYLKYTALNILRMKSLLFPVRLEDKSYHELIETLSLYRPNLYKIPSIINQPNSDIAVSVIVPIYNTARYLKACIESILEQETEIAFEIILIDDGSTDESSSIVEEFRNCEGVKIIHQENRGFSGARNRGLDEATGQYVLFCDSDDILERNAIEILFRNAEATQADIVCGGYYTFPHPQQTFCLKEEVCEKWEIKKKYKAYGFFCGKIFRRNLFQNLRLAPNLLFEDTMVSMVLLPYSGKVSIVPNVIFGYRQHPESISYSHRMSYKSLDTYWIVEVLLAQRKQLGLDNDEAFYKFLLYQLSAVTYARINQLSKDIQKQVFLLCCKLIQENKVSNIPLNNRQLDLEQAFYERNFDLWMILSRMNTYNKKIQQM